MPSLAHRAALRACFVLAYPPLSLVFRFRTGGSKNLPARGGAIVCANHASLLDPIVLQAALPRPIVYLMTAEYYDRRGLRWFCRTFEAIRVDDAGGNFAALKRTGEALQGGDVIGIFPEGAISRDGRLRSFHSGAVVLALTHGVPLVPVWIEGTFRALPRDATWIRRARISVTTGRPIPVRRADPRRVLDTDEVAGLTAMLRDAIAALAEAPDRVEPFGES